MSNNFFMFIVSISFFTLSCNTKKESISPEIKNITESVYASGIVKSKDQYEVFSKTNGILEKVFVKEGTYIKKGEALFQIDNRNSKIVTDNARLNAAANDYNLNLGKVNDAKNSIQLAFQKLKNDSLMMVRQKNLWKSEIGTKIELEQRILSYKNSKVAWEHTMTVYEDLKRQLKLISDQSKNNLQTAQSNEGDLIIRSDVDGIVYKINKEQGELVSSLSAIAVIGADDFIIELNIDEFDIVKIKPSQQVIVRMDSYNDQVFEANILSIDPMMNERTRSFKVLAAFTKKPEKLFPNLTLEANIVINTKQNTLTIPRNYLTTDSTVLLKNGEPQKVKTGLKDYYLVEILSGITSTSKLILPNNEN